MERRRFLQQLAFGAATATTAARAFESGGPASLAPAKLAQIEKLVQAELIRTSTPGLTVAIATGHEQRWAKGFGYADLENDVLATPQTVYRLASISKPITAVAVMQLVEHGALDLDAPIQKYVPVLPVRPQIITPRLLLGHLSGIRHYRGRENASTRNFASVTEALGVFANDPLLYEPGLRYEYTTYGFVILGAAVENASGLPYLDYVHRNIFDKCAMDHTQADSTYQLIPHRTRGYIKSTSGAIQNCALADTSNKIPGGGLSSTASDVAQFATALWERKLVSRASLDQMWTEQHTTDGHGTGYGLGFMLGEVNGLPRVAHTGHQQGTSTVVSLIPSARLSVAILGNLEDVDWLPLATRIQQVLLLHDPAG